MIDIHGQKNKKTIFLQQNLTNLTSKKHWKLVQVHIRCKELQWKNDKN